MKCDCYRKVNDELGKKGMKLSDKMFMFAVTESLGLNMVMGLPLERLDGKRLQRKDPKMLQVSYCPVCGTKATDDETKPANNETEPTAAAAEGRPVCEGASQQAWSQQCAVPDGARPA